MQNYSIVVVKDRQLMKQVCTYQGSCLLLYCVDYTRVKTLAKHLGHSFFPDNMNCFCLASIDAVLALQENGGGVIGFEEAACSVVILEKDR